MNPLTRGLYRVLLRLSRRPLPYPVRSKELLGALSSAASDRTRGDAGLSSTGATNVDLPGVKYLTSSLGLREALEFCFRNYPQNPPNVDVALHAIRKLSDIRKIEEESKLTRLINSNGSSRAGQISGASSTRIELGDVLVHKSTGQRMVCVFWRWDVTSGTQMVRAMPESRGFGAVVMDVMLAGEMPASEFEVCMDPLLQRCKSPELDQFFSHFSPITERFAPHPHVRYFFPGEAKGVVLTGFEEDDKVGILRNPEMLRHKIACTSAHTAAELKRLEAELEGVIERSLLRFSESISRTSGINSNNSAGPPIGMDSDEWRREIRALFQYLESRESQSYPLLFDATSMIDAVVTKRSKLDVSGLSPLSKNSNIAEVPTGGNRSSRKDASSVGASGNASNRATSVAGHSKCVARNAALLKSLQTSSEAWMTTFFGPVEATESCLLLASHARLYKVVSDLLVRRYQHRLSEVVPLLSAAYSRMHARRKASSVAAPLYTPIPTAPHRTSVTSALADDTVMRSIESLYSSSSPFDVAPGDIVRYKSDERGLLYVCVSCTGYSLQGGAGASSCLMLPLFAGGDFNDDVDDLEGLDVDEDQDQEETIHSAFADALGRLESESSSDSAEESFHYASLAELERVGTISDTTIKNSRLNAVLDRMFHVAGSDILGAGRLEPRLHLCYLSGADVKGVFANRESGSQKVHDTVGRVEASQLAALDAAVADLFVALHDFLFHGMVHDNENVEPLVDIDAPIEFLRNEVLRNFPSVENPGTPASAYASAGPAVSSTTPNAASVLHRSGRAPRDGRQEALGGKALRISEVKLLMRCASRSSEGEMVEDFLRNVDANHSNYGIAMLMAMHRQHVLVESNESAMALLNAAVSLDPQFIHAALIRDRFELLHEASASMLPAEVTEAQFRRALDAVEAHPADHMTWYHLASLASLTKKCPLSVGLLSMAKALALHPWFKEVRAYEFLRHLLDLQGTAEDKAIAAGLFSSSRALADWTELCGGRRSITKDYMGSNASATQQSGGAGGNGSADEASSTRSDASSDGDAWFRSIK